MNDWFDELQQQLQQTIEKTASEFEQQVDDAIDRVDRWLIETLDEIDTVASEFAAQAEPLIPPELHHALGELELWLEDCDRAIDASVNALIDVLLDIRENESSEGDHNFGDRDSSNSRSGSRSNPPSDPDNFDPGDIENDPNWFVPLSHVRPTAKQHPACQGCQHYHGYRYGEHLLVCAMHPYGWDDEECPDWEGDRV
jgi:hypothetical protein